MKKSSPFILMTGVLLILGFMLTVQISSLTSQKNKPNAADYLTVLGQVSQQQQENQLLNKQISQAKTQLETYQKSGNSAQSRSQALLKDWKQSQTAAGLTAVSGTGLTLTLAADSSLPGYSNISAFQPEVVLSYIINLLYSQGATAVSIQGSQGVQQRLVTTSAIRDIGGFDKGTTTVNNGYPLVPPYTIRAIGNVPRMQAILTSQNVVKDLKQLWGINCTVTTSKDVKIAAYQGTMPGTYVKEVNPQ